MKFVDEFREPALIAKTSDEIRRLADPGRHYRLMEVCGGHTHAIYRFGLKDLLPPNIELVHGPGCPVCVLPMGRIDDGLAMAERRRRHLHRVRRHDARARDARQPAGAQGARHGRAHRLLAGGRAEAGAEQNPEKHVMFFAIGFETTAPSTALTLMRAKSRGHPQLLGVLQSRDDHSGDPRDPRFAGHAHRRVHRAGPRFDRDRLPAL